MRDTIQYPVWKREPHILSEKESWEFDLAVKLLQENRHENKGIKIHRGQTVSYSSWLFSRTHVFMHSYVYFEEKTATPFNPAWVMRLPIKPNYSTPSSSPLVLIKLCVNPQGQWHYLKIEKSTRNAPAHEGRITQKILPEQAKYVVRQKEKNASAQKNSPILYKTYLLIPDLGCTLDLLLRIEKNYQERMHKHQEKSYIIHSLQKELQTHEAPLSLVSELKFIPKLPPRLIPFKVWLRIMVFLAADLDRIHQAGFIHRDLKPRNIVVNPIQMHHHKPVRAQSALIDFGLSLSMKAIRKPIYPQGTPHYMALLDELMQTISDHGTPEEKKHMMILADIFSLKRCCAHPEDYHYLCFNGHTYRDVHSHTIPSYDKWKLSSIFGPEEVKKLPIPLQHFFNTRLGVVCDESLETLLGISSLSELQIHLILFTLGLYKPLNIPKAHFVNMLPLMHLPHARTSVQEALDKVSIGVKAVAFSAFETSLHQVLKKIWLLFQNESISLRRHINLIGLIHKKYFFTFILSFLQTDFSQKDFSAALGELSQQSRKFTQDFSHALRTIALSHPIKENTPFPRVKKYLIQFHWETLFKARFVKSILVFKDPIPKTYREFRKRYFTLPFPQKENSLDSHPFPFFSSPPPHIASSSLGVISQKSRF